VGDGFLSALPFQDGMRAPPCRENHELGDGPNGTRLTSFGPVRASLPNASEGWSRLFLSSPWPRTLS
jgi:hypothetical protein